MADDQTNPYTMMGMLGLMSPNKYLNPMYKDKPLPMPGYYGDPTDASGQKIQSYQDTKAQHDAWDAAHPQGTTLTSTPKGSGNGQLDQLAGWQALTSPEMAARGNTYGDQYINATNPGGNSMTDSVLSAMGMTGVGDKMRSAGMSDANIGEMILGGPLPSGGQQQQAAAPAASSNPFNMRQAYLDALSDPQGGKPMPVPGATVQPSAPLGTPSVMDAFLANNKPSTGAGGDYSNAGFFNTLGKLRSA